MIDFDVFVSIFTLRLHSTILNISRGILSDYWFIQKPRMITDNRTRQPLALNGSQVHCQLEKLNSMEKKLHHFSGSVMLGKVTQFLHSLCYFKRTIL